MFKAQFISRGTAITLVMVGTLLLMAASAGAALAAAPGETTGVTSTTHPNEGTWYSNASPVFAWDKATAQGAAIAGYSYVLDGSPATEPDVVRDRSSLIFLPRVPLTVGSHPSEDRVADFNSDGKLDLVVENSASNTVSVFLGNGDGTFESRVDYVTGTTPWSMEVADVNQDGVDDIVTGNSAASTVSVLIGQGDGTFADKLDYTAGTGSKPECLRIGDLNGDTMPDIVTANAGNDTVGVLLNQGDGTFPAPSTFTTPSHPTSIAIADLNGDGMQDLVTANFSGNSSSVLFGLGDGTFSSATSYVTGTQPQTVVTADFDDDGSIDVAPVNYVGSASVLLNQGDGTLAEKVDYVVGSGPYSLDVFDLNHDNADDLVTVNHTANTVSILYGNGDGTFNAKNDLSTGSGPFWVALGDFDGDSYGDLAVTDETAGTVSISIGTAFLGASFGGKDDGVWYFHVRAVDVLGNGGPTSSREVRIDTTSPVTTDISEPALAGDADSAWQATGQSVSLSATDPASGLVQTFYSLDGVEHEYSGPFTVSGDGSHAITYWSTDVAGNVEVARSGWVNVWTTAPVTSIDCPGMDEGEWTMNDPQPVALTATGGHGATTLHYQVDGDEQIDIAGNEASFDLAGEGAHEVRYWSNDELGNEETPRVLQVLVDTTAPQTGATYEGGTDWQAGPVTFDLTPVDAGSGMNDGSASTLYQVDEASWQSGTEVVITESGAHEVGYYSTDAAGNVETRQSLTVFIDGDAPATTDDAPADWRATDVVVALTPTDALSGMLGGLAATTYEIDGGETQSGASVLVAAPADHSGDGARIVTYRSTDAVGNREADSSALVLIDTQAPETHDDVDAGAPVASGGSATVTLSASDAHGSRDVSGVGATHYRVDDGPWQSGTSAEVTGDGRHVVSYYSTDNAGNDEAVKTSAMLTIGTVAPGASSDDAPLGWVNHDVLVTITPGEGGVRTTWEIDGGETNTGTSVPVAAPADHSGDGVHVITYRTWSVGEVAEETRTALVRIDTVAPQTSDNAPEGWQRSAVMVTLEATDDSSGLAATAFSVDGGTPQDGTSISVSGDGVHSVGYSSRDNAGNIESERIATVRVDGSAPQVTSRHAGRWFRSKAVTVTLTGTDPGAGLAEMTYSADNGAWQMGSSAKVSGAGRHTLRYTATDACGNAVTGSFVVGIDTKRPKLSKGLASRGSKKTGSIKFRFRVTDPKKSCGGAKVTKIVVLKTSGKKVATIKGTGKVVKANANASVTLKRKLKHGSYRFKVYAVDLAGNRVVKIIPGTLKVK